MIVSALMAGLLPSKFLFSLSKNSPSHMANHMVKTQQHMNAKDTLKSRRERDAEPNSLPDKRKREQRQTPREGRGGWIGEGNDNHGTRPRVNLPPSKFHNYTPLNAPVEQVFLPIRYDSSIKWPERIRTPRRREVVTNTVVSIGTMVTTPMAALT